MQGPELPLKLADWLPSTTVKGASTTLRFHKDKDAWESLEQDPGSWNAPSVSEDQVMHVLPHTWALLAMPVYPSSSFVCAQKQSSLVYCR